MKECRFCYRMKVQHPEYIFCPYCSKPLHGEFVFIPSTTFKSSTEDVKICKNLTYWYNIHGGK